MRVQTVIKGMFHASNFLRVFMAFASNQNDITNVCVHHRIGNGFGTVKLLVGCLWDLHALQHVLHNGCR